MRIIPAVCTRGRAKKKKKREKKGKKNSAQKKSFGTSTRVTVERLHFLSHPCAPAARRHLYVKLPSRVFLSYASTLLLAVLLFALSLVGRYSSAHGLLSDGLFFYFFSLFSSGHGELKDDE